MPRVNRAGRLIADHGSLWLPSRKNYEWLLDSPEVKEWVELGLETEGTRVVYLKALNRVCRELGCKPSDLLQWDLKEARTRIMTVIAKQRDRGKLVTAKTIQGALQRFFDYHDRGINLKAKQKIRVIHHKIAIETIPTKEQVYAMASSGSLRNRALILSLFQSGVRVNCLSRWKVSLVQSQLFPDIKIPVIIKVTPDLDTKLRGYELPYYPTFLQREAATALRQYLEQRMKQGELKDDDYVFVPEAPQSRNEYLAPTQILTIIKRAAQRVGIDPKTLWTHCLRKAYRKVLNSTDMDEDTREVLMGHLPPGSRKSYFDYHDINEIAGKYARADFSEHGQVTSTEAEALKREIQTLRDAIQTIANYNDIAIRFQTEQGKSFEFAGRGEGPEPQSQIRDMQVAKIRKAESDGS